MPLENVCALISAAPEVSLERPRPLVRDLPAADPFPIEALGGVLAPAARAIQDRVQAPLAICGQSVLAAATLVVQGHADVKLPTGQARAIAGYYFTVAATGERKTSVDAEALWPVRAHEAKLREAYDPDQLVYANKLLAWEKARDTVVKRGKEDRNAIEAGLNALGASPRPPLVPLLTCSEPTYEGLCKLLAVSGPSLGVFAAEGGQFVGGHGMSDDAKLRTASGLSAVWDGEPIKRVRAEGTLVMPGRRVTMHLMVQPDVAGMMLNDPLLADQGLLSRLLVTAPEPASVDLKCLRVRLIKT